MSAVPSLQRLLNKESQDKKTILKSLFNRTESTQKTEDKKVDIKDPSFRVNYVRNVDVREAFIKKKMTFVIFGGGGQK